MLRCALIVILLLPGFALAHGLRLSATVGSEAIAGQATFADGSPVADAPVELRPDVEPAESATLARSRTDADGRFAFPTPRLPGAYRVTVDDGRGHRRETFLTLASPSPLPASAPASPPVVAIPDRHAQAGWQQWLSGLGYLLGLFGLASWWASRRGGDRRPG